MTTFELLDQFLDYEFDESNHTYVLTYPSNVPVKYSVTQLLGKYSKPFDSDFWAGKKAKKLGVTKEELLAEWTLKAETSCTVGTLFHSFMEHRISGKVYHPENNIPNQAEDKETITSRLERLQPLGEKFIQDSKHKLIPVRSEIIIGIDDIVAGQADQLFYNTGTGKLEVWDWKTNKAINMHNAYKEKLLYPLDSLDACEFTEYSLQLSMYKYILQLRGLVIGDCYFVWFNENNDDYQCFKCLDYVDIVKLIIQENS